MGSYLIYPWFAQILVKEAMSNIISTGPYAFIESTSYKYNLQNKNVNCKHELFDPAANQVYSNVYGSTIEHYSNVNSEMFSDHNFHDFIMV